MGTDVELRIEIKDLVRGWMNARNVFAHSSDMVVGLTMPSETDKREEFIRALNQYSSQLIDLLDLREPVMYEGFMELVVNGRSIVNGTHIIRGS